VIAAWSQIAPEIHGGHQIFYFGIFHRGSLRKTHEASLLWAGKLYGQSKILRKGYRLRIPCAVKTKTNRSSQRAHIRLGHVKG